MLFRPPVADDLLQRVRADGWQAGSGLAFAEAIQLGGELPACLIVESGQAAGEVGTQGSGQAHRDLGAEVDHLAGPVPAGLGGLGVLEQEQVFQDAHGPAAEGIALLPAQTGDLLGDVGEVEVEVEIGPGGGPAAQLARLAAGPGVEVALVEILA